MVSWKKSTNRNTLSIGAYHLIHHLQKPSTVIHVCIVHDNGEGKIKTGKRPFPVEDTAFQDGFSER